MKILVKSCGPILVKRLHEMDGFLGKFGVGGSTFPPIERRLVFAIVKFAPSNTWSGIGSCRKFKVSR